MAGSIETKSFFYFFISNKKGANMQLVYIYDIKAKDRKAFNRTKRKFYYHLNKLNLKNAIRTKSALIIPLGKEKAMDNFFKGFGKAIEVYKILAEYIEEL
jgi:hypothetical protein